MQFSSIAEYLRESANHEVIELITDVVEVLAGLLFTFFMTALWRKRRSRREDMLGSLKLARGVYRSFLMEEATAPLHSRRHPDLTVRRTIALAARRGKDPGLVVETVRNHLIDCLTKPDETYKPNALARYVDALCVPKMMSTIDSTTVPIFDFNDSNTRAYLLNRLKFDRSYVSASEALTRLVNALPTTNLRDAA